MKLRKILFWIRYIPRMQVSYDQYYDQIQFVDFSLMLKGHRESSGLVYTRSYFSGGSSSCGYNDSKSNSHEAALQKLENTDPCIRSPSSSQSNPKSDLQISRISQNCIDFEEVATPFDKIDNIKDMLLVLIDVLHSKFLEIIFTLILTFGLISTSSPTCSRGGVGSSRHQYKEYIPLQISCNTSEERNDW